MKKSQIIIIGDTHGSYLPMMDERDTAFLHVGDYGVGFSGRTDVTVLNTVGAKLVENGNVLFVNRGNHDNPIWWGADKKTSREPISFVDSYEIVTINDRCFLFLGGAISVDRMARVVGLNYWVNEGFDFNPAKLIAALATHNVTDIISHSAPDFCYPTTFGGIVDAFASRDATLKDELTEERKKLTEVFKLCKNYAPALKNWYNGHFHPRNKVFQTIDGVDFTCIPINEHILTR